MALATNTAGGGQTLDVDTTRNYAMGQHFRLRYCPRIMLDSVSPALVARLIAAAKWADVVHLTAVYSFPTFPTLAVCRAMGKPVVWSPRGALQRWQRSRRNRAKRAWELGCRLIMPRRTVLHLTSEMERVESLRRFPRVRSVVIPNGIEIPAEAEHPCTQPGGRIRLGFIGRLDPKKGIENLLEACRILKDSNAAFSLSVAGRGESNYTVSLQSKISDLGLRQEVTMLGHVSGASKRAFFEHADIVVVPSYTENFGMVVAEALANGVPVIASVGTPWHRVEKMGCGLWVDNSPRSIAGAIERMRREPLAVMGERGREWMATEFSWDSVARRMYDCYSTVVYGRPSFEASNESVSSTSKPMDHVTGLA